MSVGYLRVIDDHSTLSRLLARCAIGFDDSKLPRDYVGFSESYEASALLH